MSYSPPKIQQVPYPAPQSQMAARSLGGITDLIFHHTAGNPNQTPLEIDAEHRAEGWAGIGYNYVIGKDGAVYAARPMMYVPAAAYGRNTESANVVLVGNFQSDDKGYTGEPTAAQLQSAKDVALWLHKQYSSISRTIGHRDVATMFFPNDPGDYATVCPGDKFYAHLPEIKAYVLANMKAT